MAAPTAVSAQNANPIEVTADNALEWDRANRTFTATGNALITQGANSINAPSIMAYYDEGDKIAIRKVVAKPNAVLKQPKETLTAENVMANFENGVLSVVTASGNVVLRTATETLYGDNAVYDAIARVITITDNVRIEQDKSILIGSQATFDMNTNVSKLIGSPQTGGRVKATFYSEAAH